MALTSGLLVTPGAMTWSWSPSEPTSWSRHAPGSPGWPTRFPGSHRGPRM